MRAGEHFRRDSSSPALRPTQKGRPREAASESLFPSNSLILQTNFRPVVAAVIGPVDSPVRGRLSLHIESSRRCSFVVVKVLRVGRADRRRNEERGHGCCRFEFDSHDHPRDGRSWEPQYRIRNSGPHLYSGLSIKTIWSATYTAI